MHAALVALVSSIGPAPSPCPCSDASLCRPLSPQPPPRREVVAYLARTGAFGTTGDEWRNFDWDKITSVALFDPWGRDQNVTSHQEMLCTAHSKGVRILNWDGAVFSKELDGGGCYVSHWYGNLVDCYRSGDCAKAYNTSAMRLWAQQTAACMAKSGVDGAILDYEAMAISATSNLSKAITKSVCMLREELNKTIPGNTVTWTVELADYFEYGKMIELGCVDYYQALQFSRCIADTPSSRSPLVNRLNDPMALYGRTLDAYASWGVPRDRLGFVLPWYECDWKCLTDDCAQVSKHKGIPAFNQILPMIANNTGFMKYDHNLQAKILRYRDAADNNSLHELWYDDAETLAYKAAWAVGPQGKGMRSIGMWTAFAGMTSNVPKATRQALWDAIPKLGRPL